ncbi:MAG: hypothetical protein K2O49_07870, partial [Muribaculaceae bacterium]|nr:hypothetical protein [Muribaculaceae bacterium]
MRRFIPILTLGIIIIFLTFSCGDTIRTPELREAERLAELYPDSALKLLNALDSARLNEDERMLRCLLLIETKDIQYIGS